MRCGFVQTSSSLRVVEAPLYVSTGLEHQLLRGTASGGGITSTAGSPTAPGSGRAVVSHIPQVVPHVCQIWSGAGHAGLEMRNEVANVRGRSW